MVIGGLVMVTLTNGVNGEVIGQAREMTDTLDHIWAGGEKLFLENSNHHEHNYL